MNAANVHGAGDVLANISRRPGLRGQYGPCTSVGIATLRGRVGGEFSADDIFPFSQSHSPIDVADEVDFVEDEEEVVDKDEAFRIITRGRNFLLVVPRPGPMVATLLAENNCCRKGS